MSNLFLVGMPGCGKTFWGRKLANKWKIKFIDLDTYIEQKLQKSIPEIFSVIGEKEFRKIEHSNLLEIIDRYPQKTIIACGGGTPCFFNNMEQMKINGNVIYLFSNIAYLMSNISKSNKRPIFNNAENIEALLKQLLIERTYFYDQAPLHLSVEILTINNFEENFRLCLNKL